MRFYEGSIGQFIEDTNKNRIVDKLKDGFKYYGKFISPSEERAWTNSLQFLKNVVEYASPKDNWVILEFELPYSDMRIDCILFGCGSDGVEYTTLIELKQWSDKNVEECDIDENIMVTYSFGSQEMVPHPSFQVRGYHYYLKDFLQIFQDSPMVNLNSCVYCHNYTKANDSVLFSPKFTKILKEFPVFTKEDFENLGEYLKSKLASGNGLELFNRFKNSNIRPSKKFVEHSRLMIGGQNVFYLLDDQITANNTIIDRAKKCAKLKRKSVIIVKGGPGTGKSLIALNALAELLSKGYIVYHATGSAAFTKTLRKIVGFRAAKLFRYFNSFMAYGENQIDVLICDEAHRIRETSNSRYTPKTQQTNMPQIEELIRIAKVPVFFIDEYQVHRPEETGSVEKIKEMANKYNAEIYEFELKTQFRCSGSADYLHWVDNILGIRKTASDILTKKEKMEFKIFESPSSLYEAIQQKNRNKPNSARLVAGFCWPWSDPYPDGSLVKDVVIGDFRMPWEGKDGHRLASGVPPWYHWAIDPNGVNQIGCIYTIQGFEFDYIGVIFGKDLCYDSVRAEWIAQKRYSCDPVAKRSKEEDFLKHVKNIYRTLLTRGMVGCYVYFVDKETELFVRSRIET